MLREEMFFVQFRIAASVLSTGINIAEAYLKTR
jgi:hypothetical protein